MPPTALSADQLAAFAADGYVVLPAVFDRSEIEELRDAADRVLDHVLRSSVALGRVNPRLDARRFGGEVHVRKIQPVNDLSGSLTELASDERLIGPLRQLMGDEPVLMEEKLNSKQRIAATRLAGVQLSEADDGFPLHHDYGYFMLEGYPPETLSSAISIDDCSGRGPLRVVPGSHLVLLESRRPGNGVVDIDVPLAERLDIDAPAGSVMIFHSRLLHDSTPNTSGLPRRIMIYSHYPAAHGGDPDRRNAPLRAAAQQFERDAGLTVPVN